MQLIPDGFAAPQFKAPTSQARIEANRRNAMHSTGPRTEEGKAQSRQNALKHGMCSISLLMPDEDQNFSAARSQAWQAELNPEGSAVDGYLVETAVRASIHLDRLDLVYNARLADLGRNAIKAHDDRRAAEVDQLIDNFEADPVRSARKLRETPEGCDYLIGQISRLKVTLIGDPPHWDGYDSIQINKLKGYVATCRQKSSDALALCNLAIEEYRKIKHKQHVNDAKIAEWQDQYDEYDGKRRYDRERLPELAEKGRLAQSELLQVMDLEIADLEQRRDHLREQEELSLSEATIRDRFDASDEGKLLHRYVMDNRRTLFTAIKEVRGTSKKAVKAQPQEVAQPEVAPPKPPMKNRAARRQEAKAAARNEPKPKRVREGSWGENPLKRVKATKRKQRKHQR